MTTGPGKHVCNCASLAIAVFTWAGQVKPAIADTIPYFYGVGDLAGSSFYSQTYAVSGDGTVVVGLSASDAYPFGEPFRWTLTTGMQALGTLAPPPFESGAYGVSGDGGTIAGYVYLPTVGESFRWTEAEGMQTLGYLPGGDRGGHAYAISADAGAIVGAAYNGSCTEAYRWSAGTGMVGLGVLAGNWSQANGVSGDGSVVAGTSNSDNSTYEAFRWTAGEGMVGLGDLSGGGFESHASAVSADGSVIVGRSASGVNTQAFRWTQAAGMVNLGAPPGTSRSSASAVSADGSVIVGRAGTNPTSFAFIWDEVDGMRDLKQVLESDLGLDLTGWDLTSARGISTDGLTIVGQGRNPSGNTEGWIAHIPEPATLSLLLFGGIVALKRRRKPTRHRPRRRFSFGWYGQARRKWICPCVKGQSARILAANLPLAPARPGRIIPTGWI